MRRVGCKAARGSLGPPHRRRDEIWLSFALSSQLRGREERISCFHA